MMSAPPPQNPGSGCRHELKDIEGKKPQKNFPLRINLPCSPLSSSKGIHLREKHSMDFANILLAYVDCIGIRLHRL